MGTHKRKSGAVNAAQAPAQRKRYDHTAEDIINAVHQAASVKEACTILGSGISERALNARIAQLRKLETKDGRKINLKYFRRGVKYTDDYIDKLADLADETHPSGAA